MDRDDLQPRGCAAGRLPLVLEDWLRADDAVQQLLAAGQAMAFVATGRDLAAVVTARDLEFACDWAGADATVADAVSCALVDVAAGSGPVECSQAFSDAQARWHLMARVRTGRGPATRRAGV